MSDDFLSRWSRRKREGETAEPAEEPVAPPSADAPEDETEAELLARLGLKHPDEMAAGDDFKAFMKAAVPQHLRSLALRRLWRSNPTLACLDGLNDYDTDFTGTGVPAEGLKTSYQVGRGLLRRVVDAADEADPAEAPSAPTPSRETAPAPPQDTAPPEEPAPPPVAAGVPAADPEEPPVRTARRRMVFRAAAYPRGS